MTNGGGDATDRERLLKVARLLERFLRALPPDAAGPSVERIRSEALWLRQEAQAGRLRLPFSSTKDLYLCYALNEGHLAEWPDAEAVAGPLWELLLD